MPNRSRDQRGAVAPPELRRHEVGLLAPRPATLAPPPRLVVAAGLDEPAELPVGDRRGIDPERRHVHEVSRPLVVEAGRVHPCPSRRVRRGRAPRRAARRVAAGGAGAVRTCAFLGGQELDRGEQRLGVLVLVLGDHVVDEAVAQEGVRAVGAHVALLEQIDGPGADGVAIGARLGEVEQRQGLPHPAGLLEGVVEVVEALARRLGPEPPHEPEVLVVGDVGEIPEQRRHQDVVLPAEDGLVEGLQDRQEPLPGLGQGGHQRQPRCSRPRDLHRRVGELEHRRARGEAILEVVGGRPALAGPAAPGVGHGLRPVRRRRRAIERLRGRREGRGPRQRRGPDPACRGSRWWSTTPPDRRPRTPRWPRRSPARRAAAR